MSVAENKNHYTSLSSDKYNIHFGVEPFIQELFEVLLCVRYSSSRH